MVPHALDRDGRPLIRRGSRPGLAWRRVIAALLVLAAAAVLLAGCSSSARTVSAPQFGPFAGYIWNGGIVRQVSSVIVVPKLTGASGGGVAGSWIGAEGPVAGRSQSGPFFQVGVNEDWNGIPATSSNYYAFWSSAGVHFRPQYLFDVRPGDAVHVSMRVAADRLLIYADDERAGSRRTVTRRLRSEDELGDASWHQEDVTDADSGVPFTYPQLSTVHFSALRVNDHPPPAGALSVAWMTAAQALGGTKLFGPTRRGDGFSVAEIQPSAAAIEFERIAVPDDMRAYLWGAQVASWSSATAPRTITAACLSYIHVLHTNVARLRAYRWPGDVQGLIGRLIRQQHAAIGELRRLARQTTSYLADFRLLRSRNWGAVVRAKLHMAIFDPTTSSIASYIKTHWS